MGTERDLEGDAVLRDGSIAHIREATDIDEPLLEAFVGALSADAILERFTDRLDRGEALRRLSPQPGIFVLVAERDGRIVGHAAYRKETTERAEFGVIILDQFRDKGLGTILLGELAQAAHDKGILLFQGFVTPNNNAMIKVLHDLGFPTSETIEPGLVKVTFPTSVERETVATFDRRDADAAVAAMQRFFTPKGVAVIGASRNHDSIGGRLFRNLIEGDFQGPVYPVNPNTSVVQSVVAYASVLDCPGPVDLAVVVVPSAAVLQVARECVKKGVTALVVISSGFSETGSKGAELQQQLLDVCRESGMRLVGPNCMGLVNTDPEVRLDAQFSPFSPTHGGIGFLSQSGALGIAVIEHANRLGLGLSTFVSVGNKADISANDLLEYWESDDKTRLILLYLESFGNPRKFGRIARRVTRKKPVVAVKSGRYSAGFRATQSHTGALLAASDVTVDALFRYAGVIRVDTLSEMFDVASLLASQPVPKGGRVAIITNAGGAGIMAADACEASGLKVPELSPGIQAELRRFLSPEAGVKNPVDMIASATASDYASTIGVVSKDQNIDALIVLFIPPIAISPEDVARAIVTSARDLGGRLPVVATFMASHGTPDILTDGLVRVPSYAFPESGVKALARVVSYGDWLHRKAEELARYTDIRREDALGLVARNLARGAGWLPFDEAEGLLGMYGIRVVRTIRAKSPEEAGRAASGLGGKVALKGMAEGLVHKTEAGAVRLGLSGEDQVREAAEHMAAGLSSRGLKLAEFVVQPMAEEGVEMIVGVTGDPTFGPLVACGAGGTLVELFKDVSVRLAPVTERDAAEMVQELKTSALLSGYRGGPVCDVAALQEVVRRVSLLADDIAEVAELDLNPVIVTPHGATVVDFRIRLEQRPSRVTLSAKHA